MQTNEVQDFAGEIQTGRGPRPGWLIALSYLLVLWGLWYFVSTSGEGGLGGPNRVVWILLALWLVYTPLAVRKKWFAIRM